MPFRAVAEVHFWDLEANSTLGANLTAGFGEFFVVLYLDSLLRSSFPTPTYAITKMCANEERGLASPAWRRLFCPLSKPLAVESDAGLKRTQSLPALT